MNSTHNLRSLLLLPRQDRESPEVVAAIRGLIETDRKALRYYIRWIHFETSLQWQISEETIERMEVISLIRRQKRWSRLVSLLVLTVGIVIVSIGVHFGARIISTSIPELEVAQAAGYYESPSKTLWAGERVKQRAVVRRGERLQLLAGRFQMHLDSGATVACIAPVDLEIVDGWELFLHSGNACVYVPERAQGFRVNTETVKVVDLGTLFGVHVNELGQTDIHVLEGRVTGEVPGKLPIMIDSGSSRMARPGEPLSDPKPVSGEQFASQFTSLAGIAETTGSVEFLLSPPKGVRRGDLAAPSLGYFFQECRRLEIDAPVTVAAAIPGRYDMNHLPETTSLPEKTVLSSYFVHAQNSSPVPVTGTVRFYGKILGLALSSGQLNSTDARFGHSEVHYPIGNEGASRGTIYQEGEDWVEVSDDGTELKFQISCGKGAFDQIRIFVETK